MSEYPNENQHNTFKYAAVLFICLTLLLIDKNTAWLKPFRSVIERPFISLHFFPHEMAQLYNQWQQTLSDKQALVQQIEQLKLLNLQLKKQTQAAFFLEKENIKLTELLGVVRTVKNQQLKVGKVISQSINDFEKTLLINLGSDDGIQIDQAVVDYAGLMGKVVETHGHYSSVLLITSPNHATPVMNLRSGARGILFGDHVTLSLKHFPQDADITAGDTLITSGFGGIFPAGYPVALVTDIKANLPQSPNITARPISDITLSRHVIVLTNKFFD